MGTSATMEDSRSIAGTGALGPESMRDRMHMTSMNDCGVYLKGETDQVEEGIALNLPSFALCSCS